MKSKIFTLLVLCVTGLMSCQKDSVEPEIAKFEASQKATAASPAALNTTATGTSAPNAKGLLSGSPTSGTPQYLRLKLVKDASSTDEIIINFSAAAKAIYVNNEDAKAFKGNGAVSLASFSSDNIALTINAMPLPKQLTQIGLRVNVATSGTYQLNLTSVQAIPDIFEIWLMDKYKKDSLDIRHNPSYAFDVLSTDTGSFSSRRFSLRIRQNQALGVHLLNFTATKDAGGVAQVLWQTENELNYTNFTVERSVNNGQSFDVLGGFISTGAASYSLDDKTPANGANQYRLKIEDLNGTVTYSNIVTLTY